MKRIKFPHLIWLTNISFTIFVSSIDGIIYARPPLSCDHPSISISTYSPAPVPPWHRVCKVILQICKHIQFCIVRLSCKHIANIKHIQFSVANLLPTYSFCKVWIQLSTYCQHILKSVDSASLHTDTPPPIVTMTPLCVKVNTETMESNNKMQMHIPQFSHSGWF